MKRMSGICCTLALLLLSLGTVPAADAALNAAGPVSPVTTLPTWYQDLNSMALGLCLDQNGFCVVAPPFDNPVNVITQTGPISPANFPDENFYFLADSVFNVGPTLSGKAKLRFALEAAFAPVAPNTGITFLRINFQKIADGLTPNSTFTVTHPYGTFTFTSNADGSAGGVGGVFAGQVFRTEDPAAAVPGIFFPADLQAATTTNIGPFLVAAGGPVTDLATGNQYIGNPGLTTAATVGIGGIPAVITVTGPDIGGAGVNTIDSTLFSLAGKIIGIDVTPTTNRNFGATNIITPALVPQTVTVTNTTGNSITFGTPLATAGADLGDFIIAASATAGAPQFCSGATLTAAAPGNTCSFDVTFAPLAVPHAARTATVALAPTSTVAGVSDPPPVTLNLSGTAEVLVTTAALGHGTITPAPGSTAEPAGATVTFTVTPESKKFKVKDVADGINLLGTPAPAATPNVPRTPPFTLPVAAANHTVTATFMPSGDLDANGTLDVADALKAMKIVAGLQPADSDDPDNTAVKVAPLVGGKPAPDALRQAPNIGDVLVILRRVVGADTW